MSSTPSDHADQRGARGAWLVPTACFGVVWTLVVIVTLTVPKVNNTTAYYFIGAVAIGGLWWLVGLRRKLNSGEAGPPDVVGPPAATGLAAASAPAS
jgi:hypothetical protein